MQEVTLSQIKKMARNSYNSLWALAKQYGRDVKIYCHWTAGHYDQLFDDYHILIKGDGRVYVSTPNFAEVKASTYMRNSGSISIGLCCAYNAIGTNNLGNEPPTEAQLNALAQVVCVLADALDLTIDLQRIMTHAEAADNLDDIYPHEAYGPDSTCERWDLYVVHEGDNAGTGGNIIRGNANWYRASGQLKNL